MLEHTFFMPLAQLSAAAPGTAPAGSTPATAAVATPEIKPVVTTMASTMTATTTMPDMGIANLPAPGELAVVTQGKTELLLTWKDMANGETGYHVSRSTDGTTFTQIADLPKDSTTYTDKDLAAGTQYVYKVSAYSPAGEGGLAVQKGGTAPTFMGQFGQIILIVVMFGALYLFLFRGQRKEAKKKKDMMSELKKGDKIMTIGGMVARVVSIDGDEVVLKVDESANVKATYRKSAIQEVLDRDDKK